ncbi:helicase-associated domain-containing protein [Paenibacillus aurantius]|uniref:DNA 3'-5' helicase n=1 Tax=Paenibacillus aurantius TaxID=2918900 RepID=A0AA96LI40_9BACL|nr:DNA repair helicase XPB [Paenibacillus aurantius]WNQ13650.1 helicase-associated domain-containing protein [Paenibacillus aurantius]
MLLNNRTVLLETDHPEYETIRSRLALFADLVKSPENLHTYRITPFSLWSAAAAGVREEDILGLLEQYGKFRVPDSVRKEITAYYSRYGMLHLERQESRLLLVSNSADFLDRLEANPSLGGMLIGRCSAETIEIKESARGLLKKELTRLGYPVIDYAGFHEGEALDIRLQTANAKGVPFSLRSYQAEAVEVFCRTGSRHGGSGVVVLPCGAGKTVVGIGVMARLNCATLILTTNVASVRQWRKEILEKTGAGEDQIGEYTGVRKEVRPITIATYQILTHRKSKEGEFPHMHLFNERDWGLIIYDEVHLLPAPIFRVTADIQATRRLGLTATLVREDGCEEDVYALVGPKQYELPWRELEAKGWIAEVTTTEVRLPLSEKARAGYEKAGPRSRYRLAAENPDKLQVVRQLLNRHKGLPTLIIGQYLDQLRLIAEATGAPLITGATDHEERERLYRCFRSGEVSLLVVSKVANFAVDLPEAAVAIQVSGSYGSRQEEAQRLGRVLRPKAGVNRAYFYTLVSRETNEQEFALRRQMFLVEQGYHYRIVES